MARRWHVVTAWKNSGYGVARTLRLAFLGLDPEFESEITKLF